MRRWLPWIAPLILVVACSDDDDFLTGSTGGAAASAGRATGGAAGRPGNSGGGLSTPGGTGGNTVGGATLGAMAGTGGERVGGSAGMAGARAMGGSPASGGVSAMGGTPGAAGLSPGGGVPGGGGVSGGESAGGATAGGSSLAGSGGTSGGESTGGATAGGSPLAGSGGASGGAWSGGVTASGGAWSGGVATSGSGGVAGGAGADVGAAGQGGWAGAGGVAGGGAESMAGTSGNGGTGPSVVEALDIADVWSGHPVNFALVTRGSQQFVAYYDASRRMSVASRTLGNSTWTYQVLPSTLGWDSHNYVAMALDSINQIHVSGNMHGVPLVYFRTTTALDISTLATINSMVGTDETQVTYPIFFDGPAGNLVFEYRAGSSGNGNTIFNTYATATGTWTRTLNTALLNGTSSSMNAYPEGPVLGPDGYWHLVWVWRNTADASTNHDLSYAKTQDLVHWVKGNGDPITLPITPTSGDIVDPVPVGGGMINNNTRVGFDAENRPIIAYHKFDANGYTQLYEARLENSAWVVYRATDWTYRWAFGGTGTLVFVISIDTGPRVLADGTLIQDYYHAQYGGPGTLVLNPSTLHAERTMTPPIRPYPLALDTPESTYKDPPTQQGMVVRWAEDSGAGPDTSTKYMLRWETLPSNRDTARANIPPPTKLRVYGFR